MLSSETIQKIIDVLSWTVLIYMILVIIFYSSLYLISAQMVRKQRFRRKESSYLPLMRSLYTRPVSILVPAYNEEYTIVTSVQALLALDYPEHEVIVINDGSSDGTMGELFKMYELEKELRFPRILIGSQPVKQVYRSRIDARLIVIDKENGGKADALNAGIDYSSYPYFCSLDADSILERDALLKVMKPIVESDEDVIATCGSIFLVNGCTIEGGEIVEIRTPKQRIVLMQMIEYFRAFLFGRLGLSRFNMLLIVSGAFGLFQKAIVVQAGGYKEGLVGEDMELVVRLHRYMKENDIDKRIEYVPSPVCWTQAPDTMEVLRSQRSRWHRGLAETLWTHKRMIGNPRYGFVGSVSMLYFFLIELLGPIVELIGYFIIPLNLLVGTLNFEFGIVLLTVALLYGSLLSAGAVLLEEWTMHRFKNVKELIRLFLWSLTESFWYRPILVFFKLGGLIQFMTGRGQWGKMERQRLDDVVTEEAKEKTS